MSLNSNISLTFTVKNNTLKLESSSENKSLDNRVATLAGTNLNKILDRLQVKPSWADKTSVTMELNRNGNTYLADIFLPDSNPVANIKLNDEFVKTLSGVVEDPEEGWVMVESNKSKESAKTAAMPVAYLGEGSTFEVDGQKYYIAYTTGDGACGAHALLGTKSYWIGSYYFDKVRDHYTSTLSKQMKNPSIKNKWNQLMVFLLKDFMGKNPSAYSGYIFKSINHLIQNELMLELALLESKRAGLLQAQEKLFDKALSDESDSLAAVLDDNINQPQLHTRIREQLDEITTLLENTAVGAELKLNSKALADIESEREQILFRFVEKPEVLQAYEQGVSSNSYYFSTQEVGLMAELFEKRVVIFSQANGVVEKVLEEGDLNHPLVEVFHKGAHFSRLERK